MPELRVAVIASHNGSNLRALHRASLVADARFRIVLVISNNSDSGALRYARDNAIPARHLSGRTHDDPDEAIRAALVEHSADWVVTAGYLKKIGPRTRAEFSGRIINVHPALLPRHGGPGMYGGHVHQAVLDAGDPVSGVSVHLVSDEYDTGQIIAQVEVPVQPGDTVETLGARVLHAEHTLLPDVVRRIATRHTARSTLVLVRHAEPFTPRAGGPGDYERSLTGAGEQQAELLVTDLAALSPTVIFSSPYLRAVRTIQPLARRTGLPIETDHDLREWESGIGPTPDYARYYCESWAEPSLARPGGESLRQLSDRAAAILTTLAHRHRGRTVVVGSHGTFISRALIAFGRGEVDWAFSRAMPMPAVYRLDFEDERVQSTGPGLRP
ncbi:formyltransferase family protein [Nocardia sp. NPDC003999]